MKTKEAKTLRLARYLREFVALRTSSIRDIEKYDHVLWFHRMPQSKDCESPAWIEGVPEGHPWLIVKKQVLPKAPKPPNPLRYWVDLEACKRAGDKPPSLRQAAMVPNPHEKADDGESDFVQSIIDCQPEVFKAYFDYVARWMVWRDEYRRRKAIQDVYAELFSLHTQLKKQNELVEAVMGFGLLEWSRPLKSKGLAVYRHMVTAKIDLQFDAARGEMRVEPASDGCNLSIEADMLEPELRPDHESFSAFNEQLNNIGENVWDSSLMFAALKFWGQSLHADINWSQGLKPQKASVDTPSFSFAPAIFLRKRNQFGMTRIYDAMVEKMEADEEGVPHGWRSLTTDEELPAEKTDPEGNAKGPNNQGKSILPREVYFPLPANREQLQILNAVNDRNGVVVQGPPGTGKSHTIANLVCHLLATGKSVLITAETARALQVLKEKLPPSMRSLCVCLLGQGGDSFAELNSAVQEITNRYSAYNAKNYLDRIGDLEVELDENRRALAEVDQELRKLREDEVSEYSFSNGAYFGTAAKIAGRIEKERDSFGWLSIPLEAHEEPPIDGASMIEFLRIKRSYSTEVINETQKALPQSAALPRPADWADLIRFESEYQKALENISHHFDRPAFPFAVELAHDRREVLREKLLKISSDVLDLKRRNEPWCEKALMDCALGHTSMWTALLDRTRSLVDQLDSFEEKFFSYEVAMPEEFSRVGLIEDCQKASQILSEGHKWKSLGLLKSGPLKSYWYIREGVLINGKNPVSSQQMADLASCLIFQQNFEELKQIWFDFKDFSNYKNFSIFLPLLKEQIGNLQLILATSPEMDECNQILGNLSIYDWWGSTEINQIIGGIDAVEAKEKLKNAKQAVEDSLLSLEGLKVRNDCHPIVNEFEKSIKDRDVVAYARNFEKLLQLEKSKAEIDKFDHIARKINCFSPSLIDLIVETSEDEIWDRRLQDWESAWLWCHVDNWFVKRQDFNFQRKLGKKRARIEALIRETKVELAENKAWSLFFERLSKREAEALKSWREAVRAIGKGTGRSNKIARIKNEARHYMETCRKAIPVWIMPRYLVAEMVEPKPNRFDLIIVDEASQLGIESFFLFYIGKKLVIVGDDQQISPYGIGIKDDAVAGLQQHFLEGIPHQFALSPQSSIYANAKIRYQSNIVLREHFRCMPEIIQFSNDLCYAPNGTPLDPLRNYSPDRLEPIMVQHVKEGYRKGSRQNVVNPPEADAIVEKICHCINDPRYAERDFGVISLQGEAQARLIEQKLLGALEPEVIEERRIICGDSYAFQGDERGVIFLSMVAAPGESRIGTLSKDSDRQRFNVAVSRARDQIWLFHTVELDVLSGKCMRYRLLKYMLNPERAVVDESTQRFDSDFERKVFERIQSKGFHVRSQVAVGDPLNHRYRIDLVVEGMKGRLAVECDGDKWHGPENFQRDMARQRDLERAGWQFFRIRGGEFYRDSEKAMEPLWAELEAQGIYPSRVSSDHERQSPRQKPNERKAIDESTGEKDQNRNDSPGHPSNSGLGEESIKNSSGKLTTPSSSPDGTSPQKGRGKSENAKGRQKGTNNSPKESRAESRSPSSDGGSASVRDDQREALGQRFLFDSGNVEERPLPPPKDRALMDESNAFSGIIEPYQQFKETAFKDPRKVGKFQVAKNLRQIIDSEGPMVVSRVYEIYIRCCGIVRLGREIKSVLNKAMQSNISAGRVVAYDQNGDEGFLEKTVRLRSQPTVKSRELGPRGFHEVPLSEINSIYEICEKMYGEKFSNQEVGFRAVQKIYGIKNLPKENYQRFESAVKIGKQ